MDALIGSPTHQFFTDTATQLVGWIERSKTHRIGIIHDGFRVALPILQVVLSVNSGYLRYVGVRLKLTPTYAVRSSFLSASYD